MKKQLGGSGLLLAFAFAAVAAEPWTLERAVRHALTNSPDVRIAGQRIVAAQAGIAQANAAFWPRATFQSGYNVTDNPMLSFGNILNQRAYSPSINFNDVPDTDNLNVRGLLTVPLYTGGKVTADRKAAKANTAAARQEAEAVRNTLGFEVARGFFTAQKTRTFIQAAQAAVVSYETNLDTARKRLEAGTLLRADLLDIEVRLAQAREDLVRARNANALVLRALQNVLGVEEPEFTVAETAPPLLAPEMAASQPRPDLLAATERAKSAEAQVGSAKSAYLPQVSAFGSLDYDRGWELNGDGNSYTAGALLRWDLWDGNLTRAKVAEARANAEVAREQERKLRLAVNLEVEQARLGLEQATERLMVGDQSVAQAGESLALTRDRFAEGLALATQLIDAQTALTAARVRHAEAESDRQIAIAALRKALGLPPLEIK
ncbi:MAG: TolC family protein [Verrucomicrobia subdivision 3 bacterium]|nr:TolC family protein [Limisphaerales bacterium]